MSIMILFVMHSHHHYHTTDDVTAASRASATSRTESRNTVSRMSVRPDTRMTVHNQSVMGGQ